MHNGYLDQGMSINNTLSSRERFLDFLNKRTFNPHGRLGSITFYT
jgi:hypothetical protein